jgi:hypothetical protein
MELLTLLKFKIDNFIHKLDLSGWFSNEIKKQVNAHVHIENFNVNTFKATGQIQISDKIGVVPEELTGGKKGVSVNDVIFPFEKPTNFNRIPDEVIKRVSLYVAPIIYQATPTREVNVEAILNNTKAIFVNGRNYYDKEYWMQHCASSFREILVFVDPLHFNSAHKNIPDPSQSEIEKVFTFLVNSTTYLSSVVHHRPAQLIGDAEKLYPSQGYGQMKKEDFVKQQADFLEHLCIDVVYTLDVLFVNYCTSLKKKV